jgi:hypothetical protein
MVPGNGRSLIQDVQVEERYEMSTLSVKGRGKQVGLGEEQCGDGLGLRGFILNFSHRRKYTASIHKVPTYHGIPSKNNFHPSKIYPYATEAVKANVNKMDWLSKKNPAA